MSQKGVNLRLSVPRASYISDAFVEFVSTLKEAEAVKVHYHETNTMQTIRNVTELHYDVGIIRYNAMQESYFLSMLKLKNLQHRLILEYDNVIVTSKHSKIVDMQIRSYEQLEGCLELVLGDRQLPSGEYIDITGEDNEEHMARKNVFIYERGSQFEILSAVPDTYMWCSPVPEHILERYDLVQIRCGAFAHYMKDVMIFKEGHVPKQAEKQFMDILREKARDYGVYF